MGGLRARVQLPLQAGRALRRRLCPLSCPRRERWGLPTPCLQCRGMQGALLAPPRRLPWKSAQSCSWGSRGRGAKPLHWQAPPRRLQTHPLAALRQARQRALQGQERQKRARRSPPRQPQTPCLGAAWPLQLAQAQAAWQWRRHLPAPRALLPLGLLRWTAPFKGSRVPRW